MAQINTTVGDLDGNTAKILDYIQRAKAQQADLVAFPEMAITGYPPEDLLFQPSFIQANIQKMHQVVAQSQGITVVVGFVDSQDDIHNAAAIAHDGQLLGIYHKMYLPNYGVFDEDRYFKARDQCPVFVINGIHIGVNICEDIWYALGPTTVQREAGAEVIVNINASPYYAGKREFREHMLSTRASDNDVYVSYTNMVGGQDELVFDGGSTIFDQTGNIVARGKQFEEELVVVDLDVDAIFNHRLRDSRPRKDRSVLVAIGTAQVIQHSEHTQEKPRTPLDNPICAPIEPLAEIYSALVVGTRDYVRKCGFQKVVIGLSGGIDSTLTAAVAVDALGKDNVLGVAMPSRYSSDGSLTDAEALASNLGIELITVPIEEALQAMLHILSEPFKGREPDVAEENLQTRIRGNILMGISNKFDWMVLTTGNKSEMATGYATLYGDMAGGFAVIKDVPKVLVYELSKHRNANGYPKNVIPTSVIEKVPSAELKPDQTDQDTLPPYEVLDPILQAYVEEDRSLVDIVDMGFDKETVQRVITMVNRNEYKRRQAPPGVKITPRAFGRDRRLPIVNRYKQL
ncbi:MAG: NAD+ synthase (glutamine-hydrolysing) [Chloroflexi bacterium]|jgi:NAD+ synthase (glutamine-hydrolysing)|nr:MAG: NAD+ synthase (glutamine-hydrolysing) [Chloroflexota bacterium]